jgi:hypothetical protein
MVSTSLFFRMIFSKKSATCGDHALANCRIVFDLRLIKRLW